MFQLTCVATIEGNTMTHTQTDPTGRKCTHVRVFGGDKMVTVSYPTNIIHVWMFGTLNAKTILRI